MPKIFTMWPFTDKLGQAPLGYDTRQQGGQLGGRASCYIYTVLRAKKVGE